MYAKIVGGIAEDLFQRFGFAASSGPKGKRQAEGSAALVATASPYPTESNTENENRPFPGGS